jgi:hypothetical protein
MDAEHDPARLDQLRAEISARIRRVCAHLSEDQFDELVRDIATVTLKYDEERRTSPPITNKGPERAD